MNTFLSPSQEAAATHFQQFAQTKVAPIAKDLESRQICLKEFLQNFAQAGYLGLSTPSQFGGAGESFLHQTLLAEAISVYEPGLALTLSAHIACIEMLNKFGSDTQKSRYLPMLSRGEIVGTVAVSEERAGTDFQAIEALCLKTDKGFELTGKKTWVANGEIASLMIVFANIGEKGQRANFLVDLQGQNGITLHKESSRLGLRSAYLNTVEFNKVTVAADMLIDNGSQSATADEQVLFAQDIAKTIMAASAIGVARGALEAAISHAKTREQFGVNIGKNQAVQWKLADMSTESDGARLQTYRAAWSKDSQPEGLRKYAAMSKFLATKVARNATAESMQILGASGITDETPIERLYRDAKAMEIIMGTTDAQKLLLVPELGIQNS